MNEALSIRQALAKYNKIIQPIKGSSMLPMLDEDKDAVELVAVTGTLKKYDLPLFRRRNGQLVLHRVIAVKKNHYLICGDNSMEVEKVPRERILAVATGFYKDGRYVSCQDEDYLTYVQERWKDFSSREIIRKIPNDWKAVLSLYRMAVTGREEEIPISKNLNWLRLSIQIITLISHVSLKRYNLWKMPKQLLVGYLSVMKLSSVHYVTRQMARVKNSGLKRISRLQSLSM